MASFLLHSEFDPGNDILFIDPCVPASSESDIEEYAKDFTREVRARGRHPDQVLVPLADLAIDSATDPDH